MHPKATISDCIVVAQSRAGYCHSKKYHSSGKKLMWECQYGHRWKAIFKDINQDHWCPVCAINGKKKTIEDCQNLAKKKRGICLSTRYIRSDTKYKWKCQYGHIWKAEYRLVNRGHWCPICRSSKAESEVRAILERLTGWKFLRCRPEFLRGRNGYKLELDGYNEEHAIAFEYQGQDHYKPNWRRKDKIAALESLAATKKRDHRKRVTCKRKGIFLIVVPYFKSDLEKILTQKYDEFLNSIQ